MPAAWIPAKAPLQVKLGTRPQHVDVVWAVLRTHTHDMEPVKWLTARGFPTSESRIRWWDPPLLPWVLPDRTRVRGQLMVVVGPRLPRAQAAFLFQRVWEQACQQWSDIQALTGTVRLYSEPAAQAVADGWWAVSSQPSTDELWARHVRMPCPCVQEPCRQCAGARCLTWQGVPAWRSCDAVTDDALPRTHPTRAPAPRPLQLYDTVPPQGARRRKRDPWWRAGPRARRRATRLWLTHVPLQGAVHARPWRPLPGKVWTSALVWGDTARRVVCTQPHHQGHGLKLFLTRRRVSMACGTCYQQGITPLWQASRETLPPCLIPVLPSTPTPSLTPQPPTRPWPGTVCCGNVSACVEPLSPVLRRAGGPAVGCPHPGQGVRPARDGESPRWECLALRCRVVAKDRLLPAWVIEFYGGVPADVVATAWRLWQAHDPTEERKDAPQAAHWGAQDVWRWCPNPQVGLTWSDARRLTLALALKLHADGKGRGVQLLDLYGLSAPGGTDTWRVWHPQAPRWQSWLAAAVWLRPGAVNRERSGGYRWPLMRKVVLPGPGEPMTACPVWSDVPATILAPRNRRLVRLTWGPHDPSVCARRRSN
jgi:hypothetical protein